MAVQEKVFIILNASPKHTSWATTIRVVSKSVLIQCAQVHTQLCQLFDAFFIKDISTMFLGGLIIASSLRLHSDMGRKFFMS